MGLIKSSELFCWWDEMLRIISFFSILIAPVACLAISVGEITSIIPPNETILSKEITNTTDIARFIGLRVERISTPLEGGEVIPMESRDEILSAPASLVLPGGAKEFFKVVYQGPQDDQERYYRLSWLDAPISEFASEAQPKGAQALTSARIDTILVVAPRKEIFKYENNGDEVKNLGNATFRVISVGKCKNPENDKDGEGCRERYYVMPGKSIQLKHTDITHTQSHIGIWHKDDYISVK